MLYGPTLRANLLALLDAAAKAQRRGISLICRDYARDASFHQRLRDGKPVLVDTYDRVACEIARDWPQGRPWPAEIPRPSPAEISSVLDP